jgi:hypothetical protein
MKGKMESCSLRGADIIYRGEWYFHQALYSYRRLFGVLVHPVRGDKIKIYHPNGKFICTASKFAFGYGNSGGTISK